jgi:hypothetical protein
MGNEFGAAGNPSSVSKMTPVLSENKLWIILDEFYYLPISSISYFCHRRDINDPDKSVLVFRLKDNSSADGKYETATGYWKSWAIDCIETRPMPADYNHEIVNALMGAGGVGDPDAPPPFVGPAVRGRGRRGG